MPVGQRQIRIVVQILNFAVITIRVRRCFPGIFESGEEKLQLFGILLVQVPQAHSEFLETCFAVFLKVEEVRDVERTRYFTGGKNHRNDRQVVVERIMPFTLYLRGCHGAECEHHHQCFGG